jgi:hypothetical protein
LRLFSGACVRKFSNITNLKTFFSGSVDGATDRDLSEAVRATFENSKVTLFANTVSAKILHP